MPNRLQRVLARKDPLDFKNRRVTLFRKGDDIIYIPLGDRDSLMSFNQMQKLRQAGRNLDPEEVEARLDSLRGYTAANLGISVVLTTTIYGTNYAIVAEQERTDLKDRVGKLVSGYIHEKHLHSPLRALDEEMSEEVLPTTKDGEFLKGIRGHHPLPKLSRGVYDPHFVYQMTPTRTRISPSLFPVKRGGNVFCELPGSSQATRIPGASIYFQVPSNSAQLVFSYHIQFPKVPKLDGDYPHIEEEYIDEREVTLNHAEDVFKDGRLELTLQEQGLLLIALKKGRLTDTVRKLEKGEPRDYDAQNLILSEAFAPKKRGIVTRQSIPLKEHVKRYQPKK